MSHSVTNLSAMLIHESLDVDATSRRALVEDSKLWLVIKQPCHLMHTYPDTSELEPADQQTK